MSAQSQTFEEFGAGTGTKHGRERCEVRSLASGRRECCDMECILGSWRCCEEIFRSLSLVCDFQCGPPSLVYEFQCGPSLSLVYDFQCGSPLPLVYEFQCAPPSLAHEYSHKCFCSLYRFRESPRVRLSESRGPHRGKIKTVGCGVWVPIGKEDTAGKVKSTLMRASEPLGQSWHGIPESGKGLTRGVWSLPLQSLGLWLC